MASHRIEHDSLGQVAVPEHAYYGAQTQRALENFPISGVRLGARFIRTLGLVKWAAAKANADLGLLPPDLAAAIVTAASEVAHGKHDGEFAIDIFQSGSATSTNMNANEVIANRANELLGGARGSNRPIHPNDHVNRCQSSNDVVPTTIHLAALSAMTEILLPALGHLKQALQAKSELFSEIVKPGRTHLMDATPITLGQEFNGYASQIEHGLARIAGTFPHLSELALGGTAVGTGINAHAEFAAKAIAHLSAATNLPLTQAPSHFEAQGSRDAVVEASSAVKTVAVSMAKIANDLRWMASGPTAGLGEIRLPPLQPGSSIMPGKINPVIPEAVIQVAAQVIGHDTAITLAGLGGAFELNTMMPLMAYNLNFSIETLGAAAELLATKCVEGIEANEARCAELMENSLIIATALVPAIGYDAAAGIAEEALTSRESIEDIVVSRRLMTLEQARVVLNQKQMTKGGIPADSHKEGFEGPA